MHLSGCVEYSCFDLCESKVGLGVLLQHGQQQKLKLLKWRLHTTITHIKRSCVLFCFLFFSSHSLGV